MRLYKHQRGDLMGWLLVTVSLSLYPFQWHIAEFDITVTRLTWSCQSFHRINRKWSFSAIQNQTLTFLVLHSLCNTTSPSSKLTNTNNTTTNTTITLVSVTLRVKLLNTDIVRDLRGLNLLLDSLIIWTDIMLNAQSKDSVQHGITALSYTLWWC